MALDGLVAISGGCVWFGLFWLPRVVGLDVLGGLVALSGGWDWVPLPR